MIVCTLNNTTEDPKTQEYLDEYKEQVLGFMARLQSIHKNLFDSKVFSLLLPLLNSTDNNLVKRDLDLMYVIVVVIGGGGDRQ